MNPTKATTVPPSATSVSRDPVAPNLRQDGSVKEPKAARGMEIVDHGGYPELRIDGEAFFPHSAAFSYYRIPRDLWEPMLDRYRSLGINTLDLYIPWNWHEPKEGELDFDGHTNPRRDLRTLLGLIAQKGFKLIARPGPEILNEWRHGGYPDWLLTRPEYNMDPLDWIEGRYAPLDNLNTRDAEAAAGGWLDNPTHMEAVRTWFAAVAKELAPYSSHAVVHVKPEYRDGPGRDESGPLLFVQLGDDFAIGRANRVGPDFWRYVEDLRAMLVRGGLDAPVFINPTDMRVSAAGAAQTPSVGVMGQWYMQPRQGSDAEPPSLTATEADEIEFYTEELKTQPSFPPMMIEYQAGWYAPADDDGPRPNRAANTLLSSRLLIGNGIHGFSYFPLQDTFTPAGYSVPWANRSYRWDAALSPDGRPQLRLEAVRRNAQLLRRWGPLLAASHKRADFGIVYPLGAYPQELLSAGDILSVSELVRRIERLAKLTMLSSELLDPEYQPVEQLLRDPVLFLPVTDPQKAQFQLSDQAQRAIVEYVRRGGTLVVFPGQPAGTTIGELWKNAPDPTPASSESAIRRRWKFGDGEVIDSSKDFYSWISLDQSLTENRTQPASSWSIGVLDELVAGAHVRPSLKLLSKPQAAPELIASEIVTNEGTGLLGDRKSGHGFLSVTNLAEHDTAEADVQVLSPSASAKGTNDDYLPLHIVVPPRESLLLPLGMPLCFPDRSTVPCDDALSAAGAEFLGAERQGKSLVLTFFVPARADFRIRLADKPSRIALNDTDAKPDSTWQPDTKELLLTIPRGAAPNFRRTVTLDERQAGHILEHQKQNHISKAPPEDIDCYIQNAVLFPTSSNSFLRTVPALVTPGEDGKISVVVIAENRNESVSGYIDLSFDKPLHGSKSMVVPPNGATSEILDFRLPGEPASTSELADRLFRSVIEVRIGQDRRVLPIAFLLHTTGAQDHYRFDFDRDGADEWVLENDRLRLIVSPESGGRALALMDKSSGANLSTSVGLFRDNFSFTSNPPGISPARARGKYGLFNRAYSAAWNQDPAHPSLNLQYDAADTYPAGARIEKKIQFEAADAVRVDYVVSLNPETNNSSASADPLAQAFVAVNSFAADAEEGAPTQFCWQKPMPPGPPGAAKPADVQAWNVKSGDEDCEDFAREGKPIEVPAGVSKIEIRSPRRPAIELDWDCAVSCARMTIEPKVFSALFRLEFAPLTPGAEAVQYSMQIRVLGMP
ncbi:MAG TPA: beta-galactosidase [Candidatus Acidoferrum sp.]|nr:beta-galactosidase [Candidatus Acidoferrum sp.]